MRMKKSRVCRIGSVTLAAALAAVLLCACHSSTNPSSTGAATDSSTATENVGTDTQAPAISTDTVGNETDTTGKETTTGKNGPSEKTTAKGPATTTTTKRQMETTTTVSPVKHTLTLTLDQWHPGVAGYDATYTMLPMLDNQMVGAKRMTYSCAASGVKISGNTVTVPYAVRSKGQPVTITGTESTTGLKANLSIDCKSWDSTFTDEFNGTSLDSSKWAIFEEGSGGTISMSYRNNVTVADGKLSLWVKKEKLTFNGKEYDYTQGGVSTLGRFSQKYGLFTCSMKIPKQSSLNSAFWMMPGGAYGTTYMFYDSQQTTKGCSELDFVEISGYWGKKYSIGEHFYDTVNNKVHSSKGMGETPLSVEPTENFVEYSCAWLENGLYYYANGELKWCDTKIADMGGATGKKTGRPGYMILTLGLYAPDNGWCGPWEFKDSDFPISLEVDFVRAYK